MLFHNSSSDSDNSQDTGEVVSPAVVSTSAIDRLVASVLPLFNHFAPFIKFDGRKMGRTCSTHGETRGGW